VAAVVGRLRVEGRAAPNPHGAAKRVYYCAQMNLKRLLLFLILALLVVFMVQSPGEAARLVKTTGENAGEWFSAAAESFTKFLSSLV
jgi:hypothetical protein